MKGRYVFPEHRQYRIHCASDSVATEISGRREYPRIRSSQYVRHVSQMIRSRAARHFPFIAVDAIIALHVTGFRLT